MTDPLRPVDTDNQWMFDREAEMYADDPDRSPIVIALLLAALSGFLVGVVVGAAR